MDVVSRHSRSTRVCGIYILFTRIMLLVKAVMSTVRNIKRWIVCVICQCLLPDSDMTLDSLLEPQWSVLWSPFMISASISTVSWADDEDHILKVISSCYHELRRIRQVRRLVGQDVAQQLVSAYILSWLDYCTHCCLVCQLAACGKYSGSSHNGLSFRDLVKPVLKQLHWLTVEQRIACKLRLFTHHVHIYIGLAPKIPVRLCIHSLCSQWHCGRYRLRSTGSAAYFLPRTRTSLGLENVASTLQSSRLGHSSIWPSRHYWYQYIQKTTR